MNGTVIWIPTETSEGTWTLLRLYINQTRPAGLSKLALVSIAGCGGRAELRLWCVALAADRRRRFAETGCFDVSRAVCRERLQSVFVRSVP